MHYASGRDPTMERTYPAFPRSACRVYFVKFTKTSHFSTKRIIKLQSPRLGIMQIGWEKMESAWFYKHKGGMGGHFRHQTSNPVLVPSQKQGGQDLQTGRRIPPSFPVRTGATVTACLSD
jgi:hypothetical protein